MISDWFKQQILEVNPENFDNLALELFRFQAIENSIYREYLDCLNVSPSKINQIEQIPFLPIQFFKHHHIVTGRVKPQEIFESSGTTSQQTSRHLVADTAFYQIVSQQIFERFYGSLSDFHILALLPSYLERSNSSLVFMVEHFIRQTGSEVSGFFLDNLDELIEVLNAVSHASSASLRPRKVILWGVTFALLDLIERYDLSFLEGADNLIVMETGGMKGRRREMIREEVHKVLTARLYVPVIHSEYGMTELLSQGYSFGEGIFERPSTMKILLRDPNDPFESWKATGEKRRGGINVIDLANVDSCAFVETQDLGSYENKATQFRVLGRFDHSDIRGCNLLVNSF